MSDTSDTLIGKLERELGCFKAVGGLRCWPESVPILVAFEPNKIYHYPRPARIGVRIERVTPDLIDWCKVDALVDLLSRP